MPVGILSKAWTVGDHILFPAFQVILTMVVLLILRTGHTDTAYAKQEGHPVLRFFPISSLTAPYTYHWPVKLTAALLKDVKNDTRHTPPKTTGRETASALAGEGLGLLGCHLPGLRTESASNFFFLKENCLRNTCLLRNITIRILNINIVIVYNLMAQVPLN